jgi:hypothetical protein
VISVNERVIEVPWALAQLPQSGLVLDVGSCDATYLAAIANPGRSLHCLDPRDCSSAMPPGATFFCQSIIGNALAPAAYDAVLFLSTLEHIGLPTYEQALFQNGDRLALEEASRLLRPHGKVIATMPVGRSRMTTWYRQYSPEDLRALFAGWRVEISFWGFDDGQYLPIGEGDVSRCEYRETFDDGAGAGAVAGVVATVLEHGRDSPR